MAHNRLPHNHLGDNALVGDEQVNSVDSPVEYHEFKDTQDAQGGGSVDVHEVAVNVDKVILDPDSPEAVQIPDAGRGFVDLPLHDLSKGSPEDQFRAEAEESDSEENSEEEAPASDEQPSDKEE